MTYKHIKISAIPAPLGEVIDSSSATSKAIAKEMALVHAAPDLLAALEAAIAATPYGVRVNGKWGDWRDLAETAIAKAKGE